MRTVKGNKPITITPWCIVFPHHGGTMVQVLGERIHLANGYEETLQELSIHMTANTAAMPAPEAPVKKRSGGRVNMHINCNGFDLPVDPECSWDVVQNVIKCENSKTILECWLVEYELLFNKYPAFINAESVAQIYACRDRVDMATAVISWHFTSQHRRAVWYRENGMFDAAVSLKRLEKNYSFLLESIPENESTQTTEFKLDENGNLI